MYKTNRREFIAASVAIAATNPACAMLINSEETEIWHQVYFWLKNPESEADRNGLINGIKSLRKIKSVKRIVIGTPASTQQRDVTDKSWGVSLLAIFKTTNDEAAYQIDPIHLEFVAQNSTFWSKVQVYDSITYDT